ncbi:MAG TPA: SpoIIE family protein phosphatase [Candidatus Acidoferrales bacterium]|jgi:serine phosphatase RsbU (regulator of sigma subunit)|nr:SpoIIE family protein phosphatase [Candidatus Acidoferrales bacterium]
MAQSGHKIAVIEPNGTRREEEITVLPFRIGRQAESELTLRDSRISRQQAQIVNVNGGLVLEDCGSRHGTFVNGEKVLRHELKPNDKIDFGVAGSYQLIYLGEGATTIAELVERVDAPAPSQAGARELHHLGVLLDVARALGTGLSLEDILTTVVDAAIRLTGTERGVLLLAEPSGEMKTAVARNKERSTIPAEDLQVSKSVVKRVATTRRELIVSDTGDETLGNPQESMARLALRTVVAIPVDKLPVIESVDVTIASRQGELLGVLYLDSRKPTTAFSDIDREVLRTLAREAATVVENARLFASSRDKARLDHEIQIASEIQQRLLPKSLPNLPGICVAGSTLACYSVGGDCFDVIEPGGGRYGFFVGDVSGKGISAALLATLLQGVFFTTAAMDIPICDIFSRVNAYLCERTLESRYATVFYGVLEPDGTFEYVNAGHVPPIVRRQNGALEALGSQNMPVGLFAQAEYQSARVKLDPGEWVVIYTDGVSEAANKQSELFEESRLREIVERFQGSTVEEMADAIRDGVKAFTEGAPQSDDVTMLVVQYKGSAAATA